MDQITVGGVEVSVLRKAIRHLRLGVYPPSGSVRVAAPLAVSDAAIHRAIVSRLEWIKRQQARFAGQPLQFRQRLRSGERHFFLGQDYCLNVIEREGPARVSLAAGAGSLNLQIRPATGAEDRGRALDHWYRQELKRLIPPLLGRWQPVIGVQAAAWGVKKMKTRWGSCNVRARRIWLSLELVKKPLECLEYVLVHELVHLLERRHNQRFFNYMDQFLPTWRLARAALNRVPQEPVMQFHPGTER
jgi:predicted metal-dependent hydrolase